MQVHDLLPFVWAYYDASWEGAPEHCGVGGSLHIVLDDANVDAGFVQNCIKLAEAAGDVGGVALGKALLLLTEDQRWDITEQAYDYPPARYVALERYSYDLKAFLDGVQAVVEANQ